MTRHVVVTGAAGGIGGAIVAAFARLEDRVTAVDVRVEDLARTPALLPQTTSVTCDLADAGATGGLIDRIWETQGPIHVLVNAAGIYPATPFLDMTAEAWDRVQNVNVRAPMQTTVGFARRAVQAGSGGCVVNISSGAALRARPGAAHYCASKAAVEMLTRSAAVELGQHGIRVNAVSPGFVEVSSPVNPVIEAYAEAVSVNPLGRRGQPEDIAAAVVWLASDAAAWVTGSILRVDGGASAGVTTLPLHWDRVTALQHG